MRKAWATLLSRQGWKVTQATDGQEAWQLYARASETWDVVLTDLDMPRMDGLALAERIFTTPQRPPVVLISGNAAGREVKQQQGKGFATVLEKPIEPSELVRVLSQIVRRHRALKSFGTATDKPIKARVT